MDGLTTPALVWAWPSGGRRWHLRADGADLALCGVGKRSDLKNGEAFDRDGNIFVFACLACLRIERTEAPEHAGRDGGEG